MHPASNTAWSGQPWGHTTPLSPLDPASQLLERDADATMTADRQYEFTSHRTATADFTTIFYAMPMHPLPTLSETLARLKKEGYTEDFNLKGDCLAGQRSAIQLAPNEFVVDQHFRFEGPTDPGDEAILYAISSARFNLKGTLVNGYGTSSDEAADHLIRAIRQQTV